MKKRSDGRYKQTITIGRTPEGRPVCKQLYGKTKRELETKVGAFRDQANKGMIPATEKMRFAEIADLWLSVSKKDVVPGTRNMYKTIVNKHLKPRLGGYYLKELKAIHLQLIVNDLYENGYSGKTIRAAKYTANQIIEFGIDNDLVFKNPFRRVAIPKGLQRKERRALTNDEQDFILSSYEGHRMGMPALLMMCCGIRRGELIALTWADVNLDDRCLKINKAAMVTGNKTIVKDPKTPYSIRRIPIPEFLLEPLQKAKREATSEYVCPSAEGEMMTETAFKRAWSSYEHYLNILAGGKDATRKHKKVVKFDHITPHMLRHTYATLLYDAGVDVKKAQKNLGHSDVSTTLQIYTHLSDEKEKIADEEYDRYLTQRVQKSVQNRFKSQKNAK